jgi:hypothetical protein
MRCARGHLRRLERLAEEEVIIVPQRDGTVRRFPRETGEEALINLMDRPGAGKDAPPEHPMIETVRNSSEPAWGGALWDANDPDEWVKPIEDCSE